MIIFFNYFFFFLNLKNSIKKSQHFSCNDEQIDKIIFLEIICSSSHKESKAIKFI